MRVAATEGTDSGAWPGASSQIEGNEEFESHNI